MNAQIQSVFRKRKLTYTALILAVLVIYFFSSAITKFHLSEGLASFPKAFLWIGENLIPDALAVRRFPKILDKLLETVLLSVAVTVLAAIFAFFTSLFGSGATGFHGVINRSAFRVQLRRFVEKKGCCTCLVQQPFGIRPDPEELFRRSGIYSI